MADESRTPHAQGKTPCARVRAAVTATLVTERASPDRATTISRARGRPERWSEIDRARIRGRARHLRLHPLGPMVFQRYLRPVSRPRCPSRGSETVAVPNAGLSLHSSTRRGRYLARGISLRVPRLLPGVPTPGGTGGPRVPRRRGQADRRATNLFSKTMGESFFAGASERAPT